MKALDLFCGGGGAALGMIAAGFEVWGVDINPRHAKVYPGHFVCGDATRPPFDLADFDFVWASPPCQRFSPALGMSARGRNRKRNAEALAIARKAHDDLIPDVRDLLAGHPWTVIENVPAAPIRCDIALTGPTVGLRRISRRRHFETSWFPGLLPQPQVIPRREWQAGKAVTVTTSMCASSHYYPRKRAGLPGRVPNREAREVMGIDTPMTNRQIGEAVPPAYAEFIARNALELMRRE